MSTNTTYTALIVDDDENILRLTSRALAAVDIHADVAANGVAASELLSSKTYDALITDLRMPKKHGYQLISDLMEKPGKRPVIFVLTGLIEPKLALSLFERGVDSIDYKPFHFAAFAAKVRGRVEYHRACMTQEKKESPASSSKPAGNAVAQLKDDIASITTSFENAILKLKAQQSQLENGYLGSVRMLAGLVGNFGGSKGVHASRVERMAASIAEKCGMDEAALRDLKVAALLHEIGQFGMPDTIRGKPSWRFPEDVRKEYEKYPMIGAALLSEMAGTEDIVRLVECHAENFDGTGFPNRISGEDIPMGARIIRVADAYDTFLMFIEPGQGRDDAIHYLTERKGKVHDPELFKYAMAYLEQIAAEETTKEVQIIQASELQSGMELAENLYDEEGRFLAREGVHLTLALAQRLAKLIKSQPVHVFVVK